MRILLLAALAPLAIPARAQVWTVDPSTGYFRVSLAKEGLLAALGHDHVVDVREARGEIRIDGSSSSVKLEINAAGLEIDAAEALLSDGIKKPVPEDERAKIRAGMRGAKGLDVRAYPLIRFASSSIEETPLLKGTWMVTGTFELHGSTGTLEFPVTLAERPGGWWAYGYVRLRPSEYGVKPFSAMGGLIRVADEALVRFDLALKAR
jgi:polyisoprenoid-binding protein YceI